VAQKLSYVLYFKQHYSFIYHHRLTMYLGGPGSTNSPCFTSKDNTQGETCNLYNKNHHIFINHNTQRNTKNIFILDI